MTCPCCGSLVPAPSLQTRVAAAREVVSPVVGVILDVLARRPGAWVPTEMLVDALYGHLANGGPDDPRGVISVALCRQRPRLAPFGLKIVGRPTVGGYRLEVAA